MTTTRRIESLAKPFSVDITLPGSKSIALRHIVMSTLAAGPTRLDGVPHCDDVDAMLDAVARLGVQVDRRAKTATLTPPQSETGGDVELNLGMSGVSLRLLLAHAALRSTTTSFTGHAQLHARPNADLLDALETKALEEVRKRNPGFPPDEQTDIAHRIAVGALRYFLLRFTRTAVIAFDFDEALSFDGETGPYIQYAAVRANNILKKAESEGRGFTADRAEDLWSNEGLRKFLSDSDDLWDLVYTASRIDEVADQVARNMEPAVLAKFAFLLAQKFSLFYHTYRVLAEQDDDRRRLLLVIVKFVRDSLERTLDLLGITVPERM